MMLDMWKVEDWNLEDWNVVDIHAKEMWFDGNNISSSHKEKAFETERRDEKETQKTKFVWVEASMPAQKRNSSSENLLHDDDSLQQHYRRKQSRPERGGAEEEEEEDDEEDKRDDEELKEGDDPEGEGNVSCLLISSRLTMAICAVTSPSYLCTMSNLSSKNLEVILKLKGKLHFPTFPVHSSCPYHPFFSMRSMLLFLMMSLLEFNILTTGVQVISMVQSHCTIEQSYEASDLLHMHQDIHDLMEKPMLNNIVIFFAFSAVVFMVFLWIIKKTRTVMECLHRFCRECIDKSMRMGNNECPACRTHCASRRSLRDDPRFDAMIESLYNDIEKYEEEELAFHEEEKTRNKQIQASIAQIFQRQSEALVTRRQKGKDTASASNARLPRNGNAYSRRRRKNRGAEPEGSEDNEEENNHDENKDSSSTDERGTETKQRRYKRRAGAQSSRPSLSAVTADGGAIENDLEAYKEGKAASSGPVRNPEILAWGGGAARSKSVRNTRIMKLTKYFGPANLKKNDDKLDVHLMLTSLDKQRMPSLQQLYLCCPPRFSVEHLKKYVARETQLRADDIEILMVMKQLNTNDLQSTLLDPDIWLRLAVSDPDEDHVIYVLNL
ncbi:hypothetical protein TEA_006197 [Camellia sinensis var. sinensis]|uniref:RING-type domain-containing protein n=1 Tax=Camellia sinensis var. sinensis TaxID=542762 RepID=A0A4S4DRX6_CAMSN|nr:hypothetical protein TEA_006197 [Camellia sinensis var. sinensis]